MTSRPLSSRHLVTGRGPSVPRPTTTALVAVAAVLAAAGTGGRARRAPELPPHGPPPRPAAAHETPTRETARRGARRMRSLVAETPGRSEHEGGVQAGAVAQGRVPAGRRGAGRAGE